MVTECVPQCVRHMLVAFGWILYIYIYIDSTISTITRQVGTCCTSIGFRCRHLEDIRTTLLAFHSSCAGKEAMKDMNGYA